MLWAALAIGGAVGCGRAAVPTEKLADSRSAIRAAEEVGADRYTDASIHLKLAKDRLSIAERLIREGDADRAAWYLSESQADADLALAMARNQEEQAAATNARRSVMDLQVRSSQMGTIPSEPSQPSQQPSQPGQQETQP